jgi:hypothetical protein
MSDETIMGYAIVRLSAFAAGMENSHGRHQNHHGFPVPVILLLWLDLGGANAAILDNTLA